jgi:alkylation response protein AidB-like acyl-CoA dehydrogenase
MSVFTSEIGTFWTWPDVGLASAFRMGRAEVRLKGRQFRLNGHWVAASGADYSPFSLAAQSQSARL